MFRSSGRIIAALIAFAYTGAHASCYYYDGNSADTDVPCGHETNYCCPEGDTCVSNGLCQDKNNHVNGSLTYFPNDENPGPYNYTGLYASASCTSSDWTGCSSYCVKAESVETESQDEYVWACNSDLTSFCCHDDSVALDNGDCCDGTTFSLQYALVALDDTTSTTSSSATLSSATSSSATSSSVKSSPTTTSPKTSSSTATKPATIILTVMGTSTPSTSLISTTSSHPSNAISTSSTATPSTDTSSVVSTVSSSISLSPGVKAGVGVGAAAAAFLIIGLFLFWRRRSSRKPNPALFKEQMREPLYPSHMHFFADKAEMQGRPVNEVHGYSIPPRELPGNQPVELSAMDCRTPELPGQSRTRGSRKWSWKSGDTHT